MPHDYNTRAKKETEQDVLAKLEQNIINSISVLKDQVLNLKDIVIKKYKKTMIDSMLNAINWKRRLFH